jgi:hypothetical protein
VGENSPSAVKNIALTNYQTVALAISSITTGNSDYAETDNCSPRVAAKGSCTIRVTFTPSLLGTDNGTLTVNDSALNTPQTAALTGTGIVPATLSATSLSFGSVGEGSPSAVKNIALTNHQTVALAISSITTGNSDYAETDNCSPSVAAKSSCTIHMTLTPTTVGSDGGTLTVKDSASNTPQTATLTGTGILPVTLSVASLNFGKVLHGTTSAAKNVGLTNAETVALPLTSITITGPNASDFGKTTTCGNSLPAKASCSISVKFSPSIVGAETATLTITDGAVTSPQTVTLTGTGK